MPAHSVDDESEREAWIREIGAAKAMVSTLGSVEAAAKHLRGIGSEDAVDRLIPILHAQGLSGRECADRLGISQPRASRRIRRLVQWGLIAPVDPSRGGGANRYASEQVKAARIYRTSALRLIDADLTTARRADLPILREILLEIHDDLADAIDSLRL